MQTQTEVTRHDVLSPNAGPPPASLTESDRQAAAPIEAVELTSDPSRSGVTTSWAARLERWSTTRASSTIGEMAAGKVAAHAALQARQTAVEAAPAPDAAPDATLEAGKDAARARFRAARADSAIDLIRRIRSDWPRLTGVEQESALPRILDQISAFDRDPQLAALLRTRLRRDEGIVLSDRLSLAEGIRSHLAGAPARDLDLRSRPADVPALPTPEQTPTLTPAPEPEQGRTHDTQKQPDRGIARDDKSRDRGGFDIGW